MAEAKKPTGDEPTSTAGDSGPDATQVAAQQAEAEQAEERRARQVEKAEALKSVPEGAAAPNEKSARSGDTAFRQDWLVENAYNVLGVPPFEVVGAFYGWGQEYVTVSEAQKKIEEYRARVVTVHPDDAEEVA